MAAGLPKTTRVALHSGLPLQRTQGGGQVVPGRSRRSIPWSSLFPFTVLMSLCSLAVPCQLYSTASLRPFTAPLQFLADRLSHAHGTSIVCLGDSLTQGIGASRGHDYPSVLSKTLEMTVINAGVDGDETTDALKRLESDVLAKDPRMVIVELGANDLLDGQPLAQAFENLDQIVRRIDERGAMVVLVGIAPGPFGDTLQHYYDALIHKYHVAFVPKVLEGILTNPGLKSNDHLHPNDRGYELIAERIQRVVTPLLHRSEELGKPPQ